MEETKTFFLNGEEYFSDKINHLLPIIKKGKSIIYTNWIEFGIEPITKILEKNNISYRTFYGKISKNERQQIVDDFNNNKFKALIVTKAGGEGLDLKGVRNVVVLDPTWNDAGLQQVIGRAIRYKSHSHLAPSKRIVNVYFLKLVPPKDKKGVSGDQIIYDIIEKKKQTQLLINEVLKGLSI